MPTTSTAAGGGSNRGVAAACDMDMVNGGGNNRAGTRSHHFHWLLKACHENSQQAAIQMTKVCRGDALEEDVKVVQDFAIRLVQELATLGQESSTKPQATLALEQAGSMAMPYSVTNNVEDNENIFQVWNSLCQPDPNHPQNQASRSARCLLTPNRADQLLWAHQAWKANSRNIPQEGDSSSRLSMWLNIWCRPHGIPVEEWILLLPSQEFFELNEEEPSGAEAAAATITPETKNKSLLNQLASQSWDWLLSTLVIALKDWNLDAMFPTLMQPVVQEHQGRNSTIMIQCLVFIARVHSALRILQRPRIESPTLMTKIIRCAHLLQHEEESDLVQDESYNRQEQRHQHSTVLASTSTTTNATPSTKQGPVRPRKKVSLATGTRSIGDDSNLHKEGSSSLVVKPGRPPKTSMSNNDKGGIVRPKRPPGQSLKNSVSLAGKGDHDSGKRSSSTTASSSPALLSSTTGRNNGTKNDDKRPRKIRKHDQPFLSSTSSDEEDKIQRRISRSDIASGPKEGTVRKQVSFVRHRAEQQAQRHGTTASVVPFPEDSGERDGNLYGAQIGSEQVSYDDIFILPEEELAPTTEKRSQEQRHQLPTVLSPTTPTTNATSGSKRGPGRPRKISLPTGTTTTDDDNNHNKEDSSSVVVKRGPGRPRTNSKSNDDNKGEVPHKRPRGRPRSSHTAEGLSSVNPGAMAVEPRTPGKDPIAGHGDSDCMVDSRRVVKPTDDPYATKLMGQVASREELMSRFPVEQLDINTGRVLQRFDSGHFALASVSNSEYITPMYGALFGRWGTAGHKYKKFFWRFQGSSAHPQGGQEKRKSTTGERTKAKDCGKKRKRDDDSCPSEDKDHESSTSMIEDDSTIEMGKSEKIVNLNKTKNTTTSWGLKGSKTLPGGTGCDASTSKKKKVGSEKKTQSMKRAPAVVDPFVSSLIKDGQRRKQILGRHAVEQLSIQTGDVLKTFPTAFDALTHVSPGNAVRPQYVFYDALLGKRRLGHVYKGFFWRLKGSKAFPDGTVCDAWAMEEKRPPSEETQTKNKDKKHKHVDESCPSDDEDGDDDESSTSISEDSTESSVSVSPFAVARAQRAFEKEDDENSLFVDV